MLNKLLEALIGEAAVADIIQAAERDLRRTLRSALEGDARRFLDLLAPAGDGPEALRAAAGEVLAEAERLVATLGGAPGRDQGPRGLRLEALEQVAVAAERLGLDSRPARETMAEARTRSASRGRRSSAPWRRAGAGKSSLLNALAGREVSRPGPTRPVTDEPVAWVPADAAGELGPLLR